MLEVCLMLFLSRSLQYTFTTHIKHSIITPNGHQHSGCSYAKGATGNVVTEGVVYMLNGVGVETHVDLGKLILDGDYRSKHLGQF
ncbi:hydroxymethylglutaryl-CoA lyase [Salvia divinorum]|uniref:Hydroxymethylglutaryl-CoA lyase n=1 Tax=Salvia divinorum TaxID=28513 RepID=A0ABD1H0F5_SALDI